MKYLNILNATLDGIIVTGQDGIITFCNQAAYAIFGYTDPELEGQPIEVLIPKAFRHAHIAQRSTYISNPQQRIMNQNRRFMALRKDESEFSVAISLNHTEIDGETYISASIQDMSQVEEEGIKQEHAQKLEALGEMVSGIAHNFNNIIAGIAGQGYLLAKDKSLSLAGKERVQSIDSLCNQGADIIKQLMLYARHQSEEHHDFMMGEMMQEVLTIARLTASNKIPTQYSEECSDLRIHGASSQIQQTLFNLINNAAHAIGDTEGSINITTKHCATAGCQFQHCCVVHKATTSFACIQVHDTGKGIAEKHLHRIFDPFFTTKPQGQGTGLGLSTSFGIIKKHGGEITVHSKEGEGTTFIISLPVASSQKQIAPDTTVMSPVSAANAATILIIDDDSGICDIMTEILGELGYAIHTACDGEKGVDTFIQHQHEVDLVISDLALPKLGGLEVMEKVRAIKPAIPFLLITGYLSSCMEKSICCDDKTNVILKPFNFVKLSHEINRMIQR